MNTNSFIKLQKILSIIVGQWEFDSMNPFTKIYDKCSNFILILFTFCTHYFLLTLIFYYKCEKTVFEIIFYYVHFIIAIILTIMLKRVRSILKWILQYEKKTVFITLEEIKVYKKYININNALTVFFIIVINTVSWMWYILGKRDSLTVQYDPKCPLVRGQVFQIWYPFKIENYIWICQIFDVATVFCGMSLFCYYKILPLTLIVFLLGQINLLRHAIKNIDKNGKATRILRIKNCIQMHQQCIKLTHWIQDSLRGIILIQYFSYVLDTAAFMIPTLIEKSPEMKIRTFAGFVMTVMQMYFFFWFANEIQEESKAISDNIYNDFNWIEADKNEKILLLIVMIRSRQQLSLKAAAIGEMSLGSFTKIMRICYSVVTFITTMYKN